MSFDQLSGSLTNCCRSKWQQLNEGVIAVINSKRKVHLKMHDATLSVVTDL